MAFCDLGDVPLYYELAGRGEPVLFLQGVGVAGNGWRPQVETLQHRFATLICDNRGLGRSVPCHGPIRVETMARDALQLLAEVGWDRAHVVGHSLGGLIAQELALQAPQRVRSLSLMCTFARGRQAARVTPWVLWMTWRTRVGSRRNRRRAFLELLYPPEALMGVDLDQRAAQVADWIGRDLADSPPVLMKQLRAMSRHDLSARLGELAGIPTWILSAAQDRIACPSYGEELSRRIPNSVFEIMPGAAHGVTLHRPEEVNTRLIRFLTGT